MTSQSKKYLYYRMMKLAAWLFLSTLPLFGCGYRFTPAGEQIGKHINQIYIDVFANDTPEANIGPTFRNAFVNQLIAARRFETVSDEARADAVLRGRIKNLLASPLAYRTDNSIVENRVTVTLSLTLQERTTKKVLWRDDNFSQWRDFLLQGGVNNIEDAQKNALVRLAQDAAERAYRLMVADF